MSENLSYIPKYRYGAIVRFMSEKGNINDSVDKTTGTDASSAMVHTTDGWHVRESKCEPISLLRFFYWKDEGTGMRRIGLMGWFESIVITLSALIIFAMSFTDMSAPWAWVVRCLSGFMAGAVIVHTIREHRRMYRKPNPRTA